MPKTIDIERRTEEGMKEEYSAERLQVLEGLEAVRVRPGMYIGTTGSKGMHHILWEIVDNSIDEVSNGYGEKSGSIYSEWRQFLFCRIKCESRSKT